MLITCHGFKVLLNSKVHGVSLKEAAECIFSTQAIVLDDFKHSTKSEKRFNLISISPKNRILLVGFCKRQNGYETRIISARQASRKERKKFFQKYGKTIFQAIPHQSPQFKIKWLF